jgi:hypothetical protein
VAGTPTRPRAVQVLRQVYRRRRQQEQSRLRADHLERLTRAPRARAADCSEASARRLDDPLSDEPEEWTIVTFPSLDEQAHGHGHEHEASADEDTE